MNIADEFDQLAARWEEDTAFSSVLREVHQHPAYQRIIGMGPAALPLIIRRLRDDGAGHWFWALVCITGEDAASGETTMSGARRCASAHESQRRPRRNAATTRTLPRPHPTLHDRRSQHRLPHGRSPRPPSQAHRAQQRSSSDAQPREGAMTDLNVATDSAADARAKSAKELQERAEQWLDALLAQDRTRRIHMASVAVSMSDDLDKGRSCWLGDHDQRLLDAQKRQDSIREAIEDLRCNGIPEMSEAGRSAAKAVLNRISIAAGLGSLNYF